MEERELKSWSGEPLEFSATVILSGGVGCLGVSVPFQVT